MKLINWNREKNDWLKENRNVSFEDVLFLMEQGMILDDLEHPNKKGYPNQRITVFIINEYGHLVLYVETEDEIFLKTIIPSRKATKQYLEDSNE